jgi:hypothetical protein
MKDKTPEQALQDQLALLTATLAECLRQAKPGDGEDWQREAELDQARKLARVSARLGEALARLRGETRHNIHVSRGDAAQGHVTRVGQAEGDRA